MCININFICIIMRYLVIFFLYFMRRMYYNEKLITIQHPSYISSLVLSLYMRAEHLPKLSASAERNISFGDKVIVNK